MSHFLLTEWLSTKLTQQARQTRAVKSRGLDSRQERSAPTPHPSARWDMCGGRCGVSGCHIVATVTREPTAITAFAALLT